MMQSFSFFKTGLFVVAGMLLCNLAVAQKDIIAERSKVLGEVYECPRIEAPVRIDGMADDAAWEKAEWIPFMLLETLEQPLSVTRAKMVHDDESLYILFEAADLDVWGVYQDRDAKTWEEDALEFFFKTDPNNEPYYEFEITPKGTIFDARFAKRGSRAGHLGRWTSWDCSGLKFGVSIDGSLNDWSDQDTGWMLEVAIPFRSLPDVNPLPPAEGQAWLFNLARYDYSVHLDDEVELSASSPFSKVDFHRQQEWRQMKFE